MNTSAIDGHHIEPAWDLSPQAVLAKPCRGGPADAGLLAGINRRCGRTKSRWASKSDFHKYNHVLVLHDQIKFPEAKPHIASQKPQTPGLKMPQGMILGGRAPDLGTS